MDLSLALRNIPPKSTNPGTASKNPTLISWYKDIHHDQNWGIFHSISYLSGFSIEPDLGTPSYQNFRVASSHWLQTRLRNIWKEVWLKSWSWDLRTNRLKSSVLCVELKALPRLLLPSQPWTSPTFLMLLCLSLFLVSSSFVESKPQLIIWLGRHPFSGKAMTFLEPKCHHHNSVNVIGTTQIADGHCAQLFKKTPHWAKTPSPEDKDLNSRLLTEKATSFLTYTRYRVK